MQTKLMTSVLKAHAERADALCADPSLNSYERVNDAQLTKLARLMHTAALIDAPLWYHTAGRTQTVSGYGSKLVTRYKLRIGARDYRVYSRCYSNVSTEYIIALGHRFTVDLSDYVAEEV